MPVFPGDLLPDLHFCNPLKQTYSLKRSAHKLGYVSSYDAFTDIQAAAGSLLRLNSECFLFPSGCVAAVYSCVCLLACSRL